MLKPKLTTPLNRTTTKDRELYEKLKGCIGKKKYTTLEEAERKGQISYLCSFCTKFHRASIETKQVLKVIKRIKEKQMEKQIDKKKKKKHGTKPKFLVEEYLKMKSKKANSKKGKNG